MYLDTRKILIGFSDIIYCLPIPVETRKEIYNMITKIIKENLGRNDVVEQLCRLCIRLNNGSEKFPPADICEDFQATLSSVVHNLWSLADESDFIKFHEITGGIRKLFKIDLMNITNN
ncbi:unnamed protein product [Adineta steineri]|uniref:Uncharacterized protein n=1 Tax=Adineta steineri TaxID=433720 RepID=A0A819K4P2_9BILA|nr:unnamed protein product [Adineta steineri]CAF3939788.1 unnamed protein product [Adineta steineri]